VKVGNGSDKNNVDEKPIIVKLTKKDANYLVATAGNGVEATGPALITAGTDNFISVNELKALVAKGAIKAEDLTGITLADIQAGRLKPGAVVKLKTLRFGPKDRSYTATDVALKINTATNPYTFGIDALKNMNGTINATEGEITFKNVNKDALKGGPIESNATKTPGATGGTTGTTGAGTTTAPVVDTVSLEDYKRVTLIDNGGGVVAIPTMVNDKENVNWVYNATSRKVEITEEMAVQLLESGAISKKDFEEGESIKTKEGKKLPSPTFIIATLQIGDVVLENVKVTISNKVDEPTFGGLNTQLKKVNALVKGKVLYMKPKEKK
jgi:hypothetical protein